jgi:hypothetical protein
MVTSLHNLARLLRRLVYTDEFIGTCQVAVGRAGLIRNYRRARRHP